MKRELIMTVLTALVLAGPVSAADNSATHHNTNPRIRVREGASSNWAGYAAATNLTTPQSNAVSNVKGTWTVPTVSCTATNTYSSVWVGIDGYSDGSVEQTGTEQDCSNGQPKYYAWYEMYPKPGYLINMAIHAGDQMSAEVNYTGNNRFVLTLKNLTTGKNFTTTQKAHAQRQSAEWIVEAPYSGGVLPLANFGTTTINNAQATLNGVTGTISHWANDAITMVNASNAPKATPSSLSPDGRSFSVTWNSN